MASDGMSEVDRKFHQTDNLFSANDFFCGDMKEFLDTDFMGQAMPITFDLAADTESMMDQYMLDNCDFSDLLQADQHHSDSSDSGVNLTPGSVQVKQETPSNPSSPSSECSSEGYISGQDAFINAVVKIENRIPATVPEAPSFTHTFLPSLPSPSSSSSSSLAPSSPTDQTLIYIPQEERHNPTSQLILPSDLSQFPGSILSPSSSSSSVQLSSSSCALPLSSVSSVPVQLNSILNQKVQILPKPNHTSVKTLGGGRLPVSVAVSGTGAVSLVGTQTVPKIGLKPVSVKPAAAKKLVLTPEEFKKLTASGTLRFQPPTPDPAMITTATTVPMATPQCLTGDFITSDFGTGSDNNKSKRQQRMIKNRESASLSRKRKKEYLTSLEEKIHEFNTENQTLKMENERLKSKVQQLHEENVQLRQSSGAPVHKKAMLLAVAFFLTFNLSSFSSMLWGQQSHSATLEEPWSPQPLAIRGRHLLSLTDTSANLPFDKATKGSNSGPELKWNSEHARRMLEFDQDLQLLLTRGVLNESVVAAHFCPIYFNSTESSRLAEQLRGWMIREEEVKQKKQTPKAGRGAGKKKAYPPINTLKAAMQGHYARDMDNRAYRWEGRERQGQKFPMQLFQHNDPRQRLLNAIPRRNDTFYVLSFNTDYFLVPATAHNKTARPRMSLVMPVVSETLNDTMQPPEGSVGMMQIDCEILNTQLIHVRKSVFPRTPPASSDTFHPTYANHTFHSNHTANTDTHRDVPRKGRLFESRSASNQSHKQRSKRKNK